MKTLAVKLIIVCGEFAWNVLLYTGKYIFSLRDRSVLGIF